MKPLPPGCDKDEGGGLPAGFGIHEERGGVLRITGEIDMATAPAVKARLAAHPGTAIVDVRDVTFIDSSGLHVLLLAAEQRRPADALILRAPSASVRRIIELTGMTEQFTIEPGNHR